MAMAYDIDWASLADDAEGLNFMDISCHRLNMALRVICQDDLGKTAVREGLKSVKLTNPNDAAAKKLSFDGGVLHQQCAYAKGLSGAFSDSVLFRDEI